jgi:hypothetical protein
VACWEGGSAVIDRRYIDVGFAGEYFGREILERGVDLRGKLGIVGGPAGFAFVKLEIFWDFGPGPAGKPLKKVNLRN